VDRSLGDGGDDADPRAHQAAKIRDLSRHVEADLDDGDLVRRLDREERKWDADLVVERGSAPQNAIPRPERRRGRLLRRRLADVPGDPHRRDRVRVAQCLGEPPQRLQGLRNLHHEGRLRKSFDRSLDDRGGDAAGERVGDEVVAVALAAKGEEDAAGLRDPRVERPADEGAALLDGTVDDAPTRRVEQVVEGEQARSNGNEAQGRSGGTRA